MDVIDLLAAIPEAIEDQAVPAGEPLLLGAGLGGAHQLPDQRLLLCLQVVDRRDVLLRDEEQVCRRRGVDVAEAELTQPSTEKYLPLTASRRRGKRRCRSHPTSRRG